MESKREALRSMVRDFTIERADTRAAKREAQHLRYRVYCLERGLLPPSSEEGVECDEFDDRSHHIILRRCSDGEVIGTVRLVAGLPERPTDCLPMHKYCDPALFRNLALHKLGEISRLAISKQARHAGAAADRVLRLALMQGILAISREIGHTHWCALMERGLIRLLQATGVHFAPLGPMVECHGLRQPSIAAIDLTMASGRRQCPDYYNFVTGHDFRFGERRRLLVA